MKIAVQGVELLSITPNAEKLIERAARVCYKSEGLVSFDSHKYLIEKLIARGHEAMLEHASASFLCTTDRGITHELVRHRLASFAQESTRYCNYSGERFGKELTVICPPDLSPTEYQVWLNAMQDAESYYSQLMASGKSAQIARAVLPTCLKADIVVTANFREWRHIIKLRTDHAAHPQIRQLVGAIANILAVEAPSVFKGDSSVDYV